MLSAKLYTLRELFRPSLNGMPAFLLQSPSPFLCTPIDHMKTISPCVESALSPDFVSDARVCAHLLRRIRIPTHVDSSLLSEKAPPCLQSATYFLVDGLGSVSHLRTQYSCLRSRYLFRIHEPKLPDKAPARCGPHQHRYALEIQI